VSGPARAARRLLPALAVATLGTALALPAPVAVAEPSSGKKAAKVDCAKVKCIALTFDDGPGPPTSALLDTLRKHRAKATFFLVGKRVPERAGVVRRMAREGHEIGNHTYGHARLTALGDYEILDELARTQEILHEVTGKWPDIMRPPYGATDDRVAALAGEQGLTQILWTGTTLDWSSRDIEKITDATLRLARRNGVILLHDVVPHTVKAMPAVLKALKKQGYHLVTVSSLPGAAGLEPGATFPAS
jgi:peptidoglycan/xylan/chitin deacetylase (PgdA/CDA1 family)